jgi:hypothetical protein
MSLLLRNPGYVACMVGIEKTAAGVGFHWLDQPDSVRVSEGDRVELLVQHNQTSGVTLVWQQSSSGKFDADVITLAALTGEITLLQDDAKKTGTLVIDEVKVARFPKPVRAGSQVEIHPRFYRCTATFGGVEYDSDIASVSVDWPVPSKPDPGYAEPYPD